MPTVSEAAERFVAALRARHAPPTTVKAYASDLRLFARTVPADLAAVAVPAIEAFLVGDGAVSPATSRRRHATLASFYRWLVRQELVTANPMDRIDGGKPVERLPRPLAHDVVLAILTGKRAQPPGSGGSRLSPR